MNEGMLIALLVPSFIIIGLIASTAVDGHRQGIREALQRYHDGGRSRHEMALAHIAQMECELGLCEHMIDGQHPRLMLNSHGVKLWYLNGVYWREEEPCPITTDG